MRKLVLIQFPINAWKVVEGWRREVTARGQDYGYEQEGHDGPESLTWLIKIRWKLWPLLSTQCFSMIWPSDLVPDSRWPKYNPNPDFIKINILTTVHKYWMKTVTSIVNTRFFYLFDLDFYPRWPKYNPTQISSRILTKFHKGWMKTVISNVYTRFFYYLT